MLNETSLNALLKSLMYSSFHVESLNSPTGEDPFQSDILMHKEDVKLSVFAPLMIHFMTSIILENIHRFSVMGSVYVEYLKKIAKEMTDHIMVARCFMISVIRITEKLVIQVLIIP